MKNKNNSAFSVKLYIDALKQLRLIGFISLGLVSVISVLMMFNRIIGLNQGQGYRGSLPAIITSMSACLPMFFIFGVCAPLMTLYMFSFLSKRNASDYFHSFPQTRGCLYNTYFLAVATWIFIITFGTASIIGVAYGIASKYFVFSYLNLVRFSVGIFLCGLLVEVTISIACAITGTIFTNICVAGMILFLPRFLILIMVDMITSNLGLLVSSKILPLLDYNYNLVFSSISNIYRIKFYFVYGNGGLIYTAVLVILYFIAGHYLFVRRKSETAGNPSANRLLQCIIRVCIAIPVCMFSIGSLLNYITGESALHNQDIFGVFVFYLIAIAVMLLYELISTKKLKNVVRAIPSIGILAVVNLLLILSMYGIYESQLNYRPAVEDISYITVSNQNNKNSNTPDYYELKISSEKIESVELKKLMCNVLEKNIGYEKTSYPEESRKLGSSYYENGKNSKADSAKKGGYVTVGFKTGITTKYRKLFLTSEEYEGYMNMLFASEDIKDFYLNLPEYDKNLMTLDNGLTSEGNEEIYESLREEIKGLDYNTWYGLMYETGTQINLRWSYNINDTETFTYLPVSMYTPKTVLKYMNLVNGSDAGAKIDEAIGKIFENADAEYSVNISSFKTDSKDFAYNLHVSNKSILQIPLETVKKLNSIIDRKSLEKIDTLEITDKILVKMDISVNYNISKDASRYQSNFKNCSIYTYVDKKIFEEIVSLN